MSVRSVLVSGPRRSGKSTLAGLLARSVVECPPHYLRLQAAHDTHTNAVLACVPGADDAFGSGWASLHQVSYTLDRLFETIPEGLRTVRRLDRDGFVVIEADADPALRHAYPYDYRVFIMTAPSDVFEVFRTPDAAAAALQQVLQDTAAFASEIFGLFEEDPFEDAGVEHYRRWAEPYGGAHRLERMEIADDAQIRHFLMSRRWEPRSPRASSFSPTITPMVEADVVIVNAKRTDHDGGRSSKVRLTPAETAEPDSQEARRLSVLYWGDIREENAARRKLVQRLKHLS